MKKGIGLVLVFILISMIAITGCSRTANKAVETTDSSTPTPSAASTGKEDDLSKYYKKLDPPVTITIRRSSPTESVQPITEDDPWGDVGAWARWDEKNVGIKWKPKYNFSTGDENEQKFNIAMAGNDLPDYMMDLSTPMIAKLAKGGQIMPLDDLIDKYASPLVKGLLKEYDDVYQGNGFKSVTYNGKRYALPTVLDAISLQFNQPWIRSDILAQLGISKTPETLQEMEDAFKAYKTKYPNGVAYTMDKDLAGIDPVLNTFGAVSATWMKSDAGDVVYSSIQPNVKQGLAKLRDWYKLGYLDKEFIVKDWNKASESFSKDNALVFGDGNYWNPFFPFPDMNKSNANVDFSPLGFLKGESGQMLGQIMDTPVMYPGAISAKCKNPEAIIYELNWAVDSLYRNYKDLRDKFQFKFPETKRRIALNPDEVKAGKLAKYDYTQAEEGPGFLNEDGEMVNMMGFTLQSRAGYEVKAFQAAADAKKNNTFDNLEDSYMAIYNMRAQSSQNQPKAVDALVKEMLQRKSYVDQGLIKYTPFLGPPTPTMTLKSSYLKKLELQTFSDIIIGNVPLEKFDDFVKTWKAQGGDQITKEVNDWVKQAK